MPKACSNCVHFLPLKIGVRADGPVGECRRRAPVRDFAFPRARATDYCSEWSGAQEQAAAGRQEQLFSEAPTATGTALPTAARLGAAAPGSADTRPRRAKSAPAEPATAPAVPVAL